MELETASRSGHTNIDLDKNRIMIIGGRKDKIYEIHSFPINYSEEYDRSILGSVIETQIELNIIKALKKNPGGRRNAACIKVNKNNILIFGGETFESNFKNPIDDILILDFQSAKWFIAGKTGVQLQYHSICNLGGRYLVHGGLTVNNRTNNFTYEIC